MYPTGLEGRDGHVRHTPVTPLGFNASRYLLGPLACQGMSGDAVGHGPCEPSFMSVDVVSGATAGFTGANASVKSVNWPCQGMSAPSAHRRHASLWLKAQWARGDPVPSCWQLRKPVSHPDSSTSSGEKDYP